MIHEAIDAAISLAQALAVLLLVCASLATAVLYALVAAGWWACRGVRRAARTLIPRRAPSASATRPLGRAVALASGETLTQPPAPAPAVPARAVSTWARTDKEAA